MLSRIHLSALVLLIAFTACSKRLGILTLSSVVVNDSFGGCLLGRNCIMVV